MREKSVARVQDVLEERLGVDRASAIRMAETVLGGPGSNLPLGVGLIDIPLAPSVPFLMEESARSVGQAGRAFEQGDYSGALASYGAAVLQGLPGAAALKMLTPVVARGAQQILSESLTRGGRQGQRGIFLAEKWFTPQEQAARAATAKRVDDIDAAIRVRDILDSGGTVDNAVRDYRVRTGAELSKDVLRLAQQRDAEQLEANLQNVMQTLTAPIKGLRLQDVIEHPELFERIPDLADMQVDLLLQKDMSTPGSSAQYTPGAPGSIQMLASSLKGGPGESRSIMGHELQHAVDFPVGGARGYGASPLTLEMSDRYYNDQVQGYLRVLLDFENALAIRGLMDVNPGMTADDAFDKLLSEGNYFGESKDYAKPGVTINPETGSAYNSLGNRRKLALLAASYDKNKLDERKAAVSQRLKDVFEKTKDLPKGSSYERYLSERGEARARLTQRRIDLSPEERRQVFPMRAGAQAMDMPPEQTKSLYELTGGLYGLRGQSAAMPSASMGPEAPPAGPPLRDLLPNEPTTLRTLENLPQNRPYIPISTIREQLRRADVTKAEKDVLESIIAGRDDFISAEELVNAVRARSESYQLAGKDVDDFATYGLNNIGRDEGGRPWVGSDPNAFNPRTTIHRSPTPTATNNHFGDPNYFGHTRAFEDAQGIPHVVEIQSDLVQKAGKELSEEERTLLEDAFDSVVTQETVIAPILWRSSGTISGGIGGDDSIKWASSAANDILQNQEKLLQANPDFLMLLEEQIASKLPTAALAEVRSLGLENQGDLLRHIATIQTNPGAGLPNINHVSLSVALKESLNNTNRELSRLASEHGAKLEEGAAVTAQRPMFKNWERRLIREELGRAATPQLTEEYTILRNAAKRELKALKDMEEDLRRAGVSENEFAAMTFQGKKDAEYFAQQALATQKYKPVPSVVRFADADTVAKVEGWTPKLDITPGVAMDPNLANNRLPGGFAGTVNDWRYTGNVRVDKDGFWEAERFPIDATGRTIGDPIWSHSGTGNLSEEVIQRFVKQVPGKFLDAGHQSIYDRYSKEVANYLKSLGGKRVVDDTGTAWWEVPVKPSAKRVQLFSMGGGAVTVGGGVAAPGDFGYTVPTEED
jgi:hypothetical protein